VHIYESKLSINTYFYGVLYVILGGLN